MANKSTTINLPQNATDELLEQCLNALIAENHFDQQWAEILKTNLLLVKNSNGDLLNKINEMLSADLNYYSSRSDELGLTIDQHIDNIVVKLKRPLCLLFEQLADFQKSNVTDWFEFHSDIEDVAENYINSHTGKTIRYNKAAAKFQWNFLKNFRKV